ncbi:MAG: hypothetical protein RLZZ618_1848 [Pseudomonadota bacterium]|jgi:hypothetical protein
MNHIYLRRRRKLHVEPLTGAAGAELSTLGAGVPHLAMVQKEVAQFGFVLSDSLLDRLRILPVEQVTQFLLAVRKDLQAMVGAHRVHAPLYPGFPREVLALSDAELYLNAVRHYLSLRRMPSAVGQRPPLLHGKVPEVIELGTIDDFNSIFTQLASAKSSLSAQDKEDLAWFVGHHGQAVFSLLPAQVPFKENLALLGAHLLRLVPGELTLMFLHTHITTATDVLRLAVALAGGDVSLAAPTRFASMKRAERKLLLGLLEHIGNLTEDMRRWAERWKRLGKVLHPGEFAQRFPKAFAAFDVVRNDKPFVSFNSRIEVLLSDGNADAAAQELLARPGEMARRLDHLLRTAADPDAVLAGFAQVAAKVSTPVLLQVLTHFSFRGRQRLRSFFPKGDVANVFAMNAAVAPLAVELVTGVAVVCESTLLERFASLPALGRCYIDPELRHHLVPLAQRSGSRSLRTLVRGSSVPMPESPFVRLFLWWMNGRSRTDIDLSAVMYDDDFNYLDSLTYYNLRNYGGCHSGDIVDAPQGAAEFIDLDLARLRQMNVRFVVMMLTSFTMQAYCDLPECFAGWMARRDTGSGEVFEARTVVDRIDVASNTQTCLPLVFDLQERRVVWMDIALKGYPRLNNVHQNLSGVSLMLRALTALVKPDLWTLFSLHARARGEMVGSPTDAQTVFSVREGITPFDTDRVRAEFL